MVLYLIRGLPGSGKTTLASKLGMGHYEADMFFMKNGEYHFDATKLGEAHGWCQAQVENNMKRKTDVAVSNTFTCKWEMQPYLDMAAAYGYEVMEIVCRGKWSSMHGVPETVLEAMKNRWED